LALAMRIRDEALTDSDIAQPEQIIAFSPWLDIALTNKRIPDYEKRDVILDADALREIGEKYRGNVPADNYMVSPKFGDLSGLGTISVFYGTEEIFFPDCEEFCDETQNGGFPVNGYEYDKMQHDWVILPIEEAKRAVGEICALVALRDMTI
jgi:epsilon-lactone hydrolase